MKRSRDYNGEVEAQAMANCLILLSSKDKDRRNSFECKTCKKRFSSFQALGGHRASHKSLKSSIDSGKFLHGNNNSKLLSQKRKVVHECSICGMEFSMGQALGGHMRRHRATMNEIEGVPVFKKSNSSKRILCVDLNLTPDENDDFQLWPTAPAPVLRCFI
ncbi:zinc finger protein ZAT11-like [Lycium barbarum]|uniref:zinc finger protein ZAT11-like n=1 Tax=Lycium barbarum TaxID=112863 RepID=UPI00293E6545|nr:zinc finger protein ZAT11-like [Lycium barbarum]